MSVYRLWSRMKYITQQIEIQFYTDIHGSTKISNTSVKT